MKENKRFICGVMLAIGLTLMIETIVKDIVLIGVTSIAFLAVSIAMLIYDKKKSGESYGA